MKKIEPLGYNTKKAAEIIDSRGLEGVFLGSAENIYYATGCPTLPGTGNPILYALRNALPSFAFIDKEGKTTLFTWFGVTLGVEFSSEVVTYADIAGAKDELRSFFKDKRKIGVDYGVPPYALEIIKNNSAGIEYADDLMIQLRLIKSQKEIEMLEKSAKISQDVLKNIGSRLREGITRESLIQEIRSMMMQFGATAVDHLTVAFGPSNPEIVIEEMLTKGELITIDIGAVYEGYVSDIRRLYYSGDTVPDEELKLYEIVKATLDSLQESISLGMTFSQVYDLAVKLYEKNGLQPLFTSAGHSIGLVTEEAHFSPESDLTVSEDMVVNLELYVPDKDGIMIGDEETYLVTSRGLKKITDLDRKIFVLNL